MGWPQSPPFPGLVWLVCSQDGLNGTSSRGRDYPPNSVSLWGPDTVRRESRNKQVVIVTWTQQLSSWGSGPVREKLWSQLLTHCGLLTMQEPETVSLATALTDQPAGGEGMWKSVPVGGLGI